MSNNCKTCKCDFVKKQEKKEDDWSEVIRIFEGRPSSTKKVEEPCKK